MRDKIKNYIIESSYVKMKTAEECLDAIEQTTKWVLEAYQEGGKLVLFGNGGSAADAQHIAGELVNYFRIPTRPMVDCLALTTNTSVLTAIANDTSYDNVFAKQVESLVNCRDVVIGISTSGNAKNVIKGLEMAKKRGAKTVLMTGKTGGKAATIADLSIKVPSNDTPKIQESHISIGHIMCEIIEYELFKDYIPNSEKLKEATASAPVRIHLGEGGDTNYYIDKMGWGCVVNVTLNSHKYTCTLKKDDNQKEIKVITNNFFENKELKEEYYIDFSKNKEDLIAATIKEIYPEFKGEVIIDTNVPKFSGLGGSSSLCVALINALTKIHGKELLSPKITASLAYNIERNIMGVNGGYQDQFAAAFANGASYMEFKKVKKEDKLADTIVVPLNLKSDINNKLNENLLLFYLSRESTGSNIHDEQEKHFSANDEELLILLKKKREISIEIRDALSEGEIKKLGKLLIEDHEIKKKLSPKVTTKTIEEIFTSAYNMGAYGGGICGAGSGGCIFLFCDKEKRQDIIQMIQNKGGIYLQHEVISKN